MSRETMQGGKRPGFYAYLSEQAIAKLRWLKQVSNPRLTMSMVVEVLLLRAKAKDVQLASQLIQWDGTAEGDTCDSEDKA